jgi:hypothetical protein
MPETRDIAQLKQAMIQHFEDDKDSFGGIENTLVKISSSVDEHAKGFKDYVLDQEKVHDVMKNEYLELKLAIHDLKEAGAPMAEWFSHYTFGKKALLGLMGIVGAIIGISLGVKNLFR